MEMRLRIIPWFRVIFIIVVLDLLLRWIFVMVRLQVRKLLRIPFRRKILRMVRLLFPNYLKVYWI